MNTERITTSIEELRGQIRGSAVRKSRSASTVPARYFRMLSRLQEPEPFKVGDIVSGDRSLLPGKERSRLILTLGSEGFVEASWIYWPGCGATPHAKAVHRSVSRHFHRPPRFSVRCRHPVKADHVTDPCWHRRVRARMVRARHHRQSRSGLAR